MCVYVSVCARAYIDVCLFLRILLEVKYSMLKICLKS